MSSDERAAMLVQYMDRLRDKNPSAPSDWIRAKAEELVEKKLGPETPPEVAEEVPQPVEPRGLRSPEPEETAWLPPTPKIRNFGDSMTALGGVLIFAGTIAIIGGSFKANSYSPNGAIQQITVETVRNGWWLTGIGLMIAGMIGVCTGRICLQIRHNTRRVIEALEKINDRTEEQAG